MMMFMRAEVCLIDVLVDDNVLLVTCFIMYGWYQHLHLMDPNFRPLYL